MENTLTATTEQGLKDKVDAILAKFGLDFIIEKHPMVAISKEGKRWDSSYFGLINSKSGEVINTVKAGYTISQNHEIVELVLRGMEKFGDKLEVTKAGTLNGGRKVFIQLKINAFNAIEGDTITQYITIIDSNDGSTGLSIGIGDITMSCSNQFVRFYKKGDAKFRHTATIEQKLKTIPYLIEVGLTESKAQMALYAKMASLDITQRNVHEMVKAVLGYDREITATEVMATKKARSLAIMDELYACISSELADKGFNWWGLHSGVTRYTTHVKKHPKRDNGDIESLMIGGAYQMNQASLNFVKSKLNIE